MIVGLGIHGYSSWRNRCRIAKAGSTIAKIELALERYKTDDGLYPNYSGNLNSSDAGDNKITKTLIDYVDFKTDNPFEDLEKYGLTLRSAQNIKLNMNLMIDQETVFSKNPSLKSCIEHYLL